MVQQHFQGAFVFDASRNDQVGPAFAWFDEFEVHGAHGFQVLLNDAVQRAAALDGVALQASQDADVGVGIDENFDVELVAQFRQGKEQ